MIGRLFEADSAQALRLLAHLRRVSATLVLYYYSSIPDGEMPVLLEKIGFDRPMLVHRTPSASVAAFRQPF
jgi:hypothetical protein